MRIFFLVLFTIVLGLQSIRGFLTMAEWKINQTEIIAKFCVNKSKPALKCNGKCHLTKQLAAQEDSSDWTKNKKTKSHKKEIQECKYIPVNPEITQDQELIFATLQKWNFSTNSEYKFEKINSQFQPPQFFNNI